MVRGGGGAKQGHERWRSESEVGKGGGVVRTGVVRSGGGEKRMEAARSAWRRDEEERSQQTDGPHLPDGCRVNSSDQISDDERAERASARGSQSCGFGGASGDHVSHKSPRWREASLPADATCRRVLIDIRTEGGVADLAQHLVDDTPHRIHRDCEPDATMGVTQQRQRDSHPMGAGEDEA